MKSLLTLALLFFTLLTGCLDTDGEIKGQTTNGSNENPLSPVNILPGTLSPSVLIGEVAQLPAPFSGGCNANEIIEWDGADWRCISTPSVAGGAATTVPASGVQPGNFLPGVLLPANQLTGALNPTSQIGSGALHSGVTLNTNQLTSSCANNQILQADGSGNFVCANLPSPSAAPVASVFGRVGAVTAAAGDYSANLITNVPSGTISSNTVQAALNELDSEKLALNGGTLSGDLFLGAGTLTNASANQDLSVTGNLEVDGTLYGDGSGLTGVTASAAGSNFQIQFNSGGVLGADSQFVYNSSTKSLILGPSLAAVTGRHAIAMYKPGNRVRAAFLNDISGTDAGTDGLNLEYENLNFSIDNKEAGALLFRTNNTERLRIDSVGNVGIGTITPGERLEVIGNIRGTQLCIGADCRSAWPGAGGGGTVTSVATGTGLTGGPITGSGTISIANSGVDTLQLANDAVTSAKIFNGTIVNDDIATNTIDATTKLTSSCANNQILQADGSGNFVCVNAPSAPVTSVLGRVGVVTAQAGDYTAAQITNVPFGSIAAVDVQDAIEELAVEKLNTAGGALTGNLNMSTNRIINLGEPASAQDAATRNYVDTQIAGVSGGSDNLGNHTATQNINLGANRLVGNGGARGFFISNAGDVGLGTTSPSYEMHIRNNSTVRSTVETTSSGGSSSFFLDNDTGPIGGILVGGSNFSAPLFRDKVALTAGSNAEGVSVHTFSAKPIEFYTANTERMIIDEVGNVGVGTASPAALLDVEGDIKLGNSSATCDATTEGSQRYNSTLKKMEFCDGAVWAVIGGAPSCTRRAASAVSTLTVSTSCLAGETMTGGGCDVPASGGSLVDTFPSSDTTWSCRRTIASAGVFSAYAICCN